MTDVPGGAGLVAAGVVLLGCAIALVLRARAFVPGTCAGGAGVLLVVIGLPVVPVDPAVLAAAAAVALTLLVLTAPRPRWDTAAALALAGVVGGAPAVAWRLGRVGGFDGGDVAWTVSGLAAVSLSHLWWRVEHARPGERGGLLWVLCATAVALCANAFAGLAGSPPGASDLAHATLGLVGVAAVVGTASTAPDGRWVASRSVAWACTVACVFAAATLVLTLVEQVRGGPPGAVATAAVAVLGGVLWRPLLRATQALCDAALFGSRPDPLAAAQRVAVSAVDDPAAALRALQEGLALPYACLRVAGEDPVEAGTTTPARRVVELRDGPADVGQIEVGVRPGDRTLSRDDERVLALAAPLLLQTVRARTQSARLRRAREEAAMAREEERRRLRHDLHDGLGPRLTGIAFTADAAGLACTQDDVARMLVRIRSESETAISDVRDLVDALRPPALDELGLVGAVTAAGESFPTLTVRVTAADLPPLPAAVEVAAYRIVVEALTNVARHSGATRARVGLARRGDVLVIEVRDDGVGGTWRPGVGLSSMRSRAVELGGSVQLDGDGGGGRVVAHLPLGRDPSGAGADPDVLPPAAATSHPTEGVWS